MLPTTVTKELTVVLRLMLPIVEFMYIEWSNGDTFEGDKTY